MKLRLDTISAPATGNQAAKILRAVKTGKPISNPQSKAFIASLVAGAKVTAAGKATRAIRSAGR